MSQLAFDIDIEPEGDAVISPCGVYRYSLARRWEPDGTTALWVMLNPSTADATTNDPTIRRVVGFSRRWGLAAAVVVNLFALRATNPVELRAVSNPVGPECDEHILGALSVADAVIAAWGAVHPHLREREAAVKELLADNASVVECLGVTKNGSPRHPLYQPAGQPRQRFEVRP